MKFKILGVLGALVVMVLCVSINIYSSSKVISENAKRVNDSSDEVENNKKNDSEDKLKEDKKDDTTHKIAVVYFSAFDNIKKVSEYIRDETKGTLFEIVPEEAYTKDDVAYTDSASRSARESGDSKVRPKLKNEIKLDGYDVIYLGYPVWNDDVPKVVLTFIDNVKLDGKTVIPYGMSGDADILNSVKTLKDYNKNVKWRDGKLLSDDKNKVVEWVKSLKY